MAALRRVERALRGEQVRPRAGQDQEQLSALLPVLGEGFGDQAIERLERHPLGLELVQQGRELARQAERMLERPVEGGQQAGEQQLAAQRPDRRRQRELERAIEEQLVGVDLADRLNPRQQHGAAGRPAQKRLAQAPAGAPGRQQDQHVGERQTMVAGLRQQAGGERVDERQPGGNGGDAHDASVYHKCSAVVRICAVF